MTLLIFALIIVIVVALLVWACDSIPMPPPLGIIVRVAIILVGALVVLNKAGLV
jgi:hypothetical protein